MNFIVFRIFADYSRKPEDLLLMMGTEILKIDAEMAEKIEVEVGNPHLKTDRKSWLMMWFSKIMAPSVDNYTFVVFSLTVVS